MTKLREKGAVLNKLNKNILGVFLVYAAVFTACYAAAAPNAPYLSKDLTLEKDTPYEKAALESSNNKDAIRLERDTRIESARGVYKTSSAYFYFSGLILDLGKAVKEESVFDEKARPISSNQIIVDPAHPEISQRRLISNIAYNQIDKPISYTEEIFITAKDYLTDTIVRLLSTTDVYKVEYDELKNPTTILGNTEVVISDDKGNSLLMIKGSFTKRARYNLDGKITGYCRYGIDNIVLSDGAGEVIITAPPLMTDTGDTAEYRVGIVNIADKKALEHILNSQSFISQLLEKFGVAELFYKAFYTEKFYTSLTYLKIENTPEEIMSLANITTAFKNLIRERQQAYALFQNDIDGYYEKLAKTLFENENLWWGKDIGPQEYYAGDDKILSKEEYRKMVDEAIVSLSRNTNAVSAAGAPQRILSLEQYLRSQMIMNSKLIYAQSLKNAVSNMQNDIATAMHKINRPVLIYGKNTIEAVIVLPEKTHARAKK
jgi:hypothetical protein